MVQGASVISDSGCSGAATAIELARRDVLDAVQVSVNPRAIQTGRVSAVAKDGIEMVSVD